MLAARAQQLTTCLSMHTQADLKAQEVILAEIREFEASAKAELEQLNKSASSNMRLRKKDIQVLRDAANRWTDNLFEVCHCVSPGLWQTLHKPSPSLHTRGADQKLPRESRHRGKRPQRTIRS